LRWNLDNHAILSQFEEIEKKVGKLIDVCKSLETANSELSKNIKRLEEELQHKVEAENNYQEERALIRSKIDGLLGRIEQITEVQ
jgi:protein-arginine kinase activator protein McsA